MLRKMSVRESPDPQIGVMLQYTVGGLISSFLRNNTIINELICKNNPQIEADMVGELYQDLIDAYRTVSAPLPSLKRGLKTFMKTRSLFSTGISFFWNYDSYKTISKITKPRIYS